MGKMMNRMDRLFAILVQLQTKRIVKAKEIAERFDISLRTVYRDISALEEAGIPIGSNAVIGYYLEEGYHSPPVMFTVQEAGALITAEKFMEKFSDCSMEMHFHSALDKIKAVMKNQDKDYLERLQGKIEVWHFQEKKEMSENMPLIQYALSCRRVINIKYHSQGSQYPVCRDIEPLGMGFL
jgi:predicted DNA-binding transcriptional regulator YafY